MNVFVQQIAPALAIIISALANLVYGGEDFDQSHQLAFGHVAHFYAQLGHCFNRGADHHNRPGGLVSGNALVDTGDVDVRIDSARLPQSVHRGVTI